MTMFKVKFMTDHPNDVRELAHSLNGGMIKAEGDGMYRAAFISQADALSFTECFDVSHYGNRNEIEVVS